MRRTVPTLALASALLGGLPACTLVWEPVYYDAAAIPDVGTDAWTPDADLDAAPIPDAGTDVFVPVDAWVRPPEICDNGVDDNGDLLADCNDPDCFASLSCCDPTRGDDRYGLGDARGTLVAEWTEQSLMRSTSGSSVSLSTAGADRYATLYRNRCVPLGQGAHLELRVSSSSLRTGEELRVVLSPASAPGPAGFLDELSIAIDDHNRLTASRTGRRVHLATTEPCVADDAAQLGTQTTLTLDLVPGVASSQAALIARLAIFTNTGTCGGSSRTLFAEEAILAADLVRTPADASYSCQDSPGLYVAVEVRSGDAGSGGFSIVPVSGTTPAVTVRPLECTSPGVFARSTLVLDRASVDVAGATYTAGGIGAPDLVPAGAQWALAYDASEEDRSEELFRTLTTSIGVGRGSAYDTDAWQRAPSSQVSSVGPRSREPSLVVGSTPLLTWARESATPGAYEIVRSTFDWASGVGTASTVIAPDASCHSLREPTSAYAPDAAGTEWLFARCDRGTDSTLGLWERTAGTTTPRTTDVLPDAAVSRRVVAADVLATTDASDRTSFALWVLARSATDLAEVHLFLADAVEAGEVPTFVPYAGNPVLRDGDGSLPACPAGSSCRLTSLSVAQIPQTGADRLRFLFARSRVGSAGVYELVAAEQTAPHALDP